METKWRHTNLSSISRSLSRISPHSSSVLQQIFVVVQHNHILFVAKNISYTLYGISAVEYFKRLRFFRADSGHEVEKKTPQSPRNLYNRFISAWIPPLMFFSIVAFQYSAEHIHYSLNRTSNIACYRPVALCWFIE